MPLLGGSGRHAQLAGGVWVKYYEFSRTVFGARPGPGLAATDPQASSAPGCALLPAAAEQHHRASTRFTVLGILQLVSPCLARLPARHTGIWGRRREGGQL